MVQNLCFLGAVYKFGIEVTFCSDLLFIKRKWVVHIVIVDLFILDTSFLSGEGLMNIFSKPVAYFFTYLTVIFKNIF